ncbi:hypothetical protein T05_9185 [Trichinella murrelli]|uniref:PiggyBac transposable element-derived protein domain-containing protein n=1 Tax=Trichinella murrelli TaxID=144512 RepID=A0A0V0T3L7_9BILA|nr:hypothetical protein T05_9185 [Trichinella murrelli]
MCGISGMFYDFVFYEVCRPKLRLEDDGIWTCGTIRSNGLRGCPLMSEQALNAHVIIAVEWYDNRCVTLTSSYLRVKAQKRVIVKLPSIVHNYNMHMGAVQTQSQELKLNKDYFFGYCNGSENETLLGSL